MNRSAQRRGARLRAKARRLTSPRAHATIGSPLEQMITSAPPPPVVTFGILVADVFVPPLEALPAAGELVATDDFLIAPGGCAANVALALRRHGVGVAVGGRVGDDVFGELVTREL